MEHENSDIFRSPWISSVTKSTSLLRSTQDFLKSLSHMFSYIDKMSKISKVKSYLKSEIDSLKYYALIDQL